VWAGQIHFRSGNQLIGVEYDNEATAQAIRDRCARWVDDSARERPAAFGVRTAPVGLRRRRAGIVHHGGAVRYRTRDLASAVEALATILAGIEASPAPGEVFVPARAFTANGRAALLLDSAGVELDDRPLHKARISEVQGWRAVLDARTGELLADGGRLPLAGIVVAGPVAEVSADDLRRYIWSVSQGDKDRWAFVLDRRSDVIHGVADDRAVAALIAILT
jgi:hypothetical protein